MGRILRTLGFIVLVLDIAGITEFYNADSWRNTIIHTKRNVLNAPLVF